MSSKSQLIKQINEDWAEEPQSDICLSILDLLLKLPTDKPSHLTYGRLRNTISQSYADRELLLAVQYLTGDRTQLLELHYELIDEDDIPYPLDDDSVRLAQETGELFHPETGDIVNNYKDKVVLYFMPSNLVKNIIQ